MIYKLLKLSSAVISRYAPAATDCEQRSILFPAIIQCNSAKYTIDKAIN